MSRHRCPLACGHICLGIIVRGTVVPRNECPGVGMRDILRGGGGGGGGGTTMPTTPALITT